MKCKKSLMGFAALLIVIFHFYIPLSGGSIEIGIKNGAFIGVDIFFFLSACSLGKKEKIDYWDFVKNRFLTIYIPFIVFTIVAAIYKGYDLSKIVKIIFLSELINKGGGSFLWFAPGIMLIYLIAPPMVALKNKISFRAIPVFLLAWAIIAFTYQYALNQTALLIIINRLPIFIIGLFYKDIRNIVIKKNAIWWLTALLGIGTVLMYKYAIFVRLSKPITDFYYIVAIPLCVAIVGLWDNISVRSKYNNIPLSFIGNFTFEIYCIQMIFGYSIETAILRKTNNNPLAFYIFTIILLLISYLTFYFKKIVITLLQRRNKNEKKTS